MKEKEEVQKGKMGVGVDFSGATEGAHGVTGAAPTGKAGEGTPQRMSAHRKRDAVLRLMRGETLETLSREMCVPAGLLSQWRDAFIAAGEAALMSRELDARDEKLRMQQSKIGELTMENELLRQKAKRMEAGLPLARWRSRR